MEKSFRPRIKICCIENIEEARMAIRYGADALGFVSEMPSGPGVISLNLIRKIIKEIPAGVSTFLLTSKRDAESIIKDQKYCRANTIQICDSLLEGSYAELKDAMLGISIVQVVHVRGKESVFEAVKVSAYVDAILLDSGNQNTKVKELGGTGRVHDWKISKEIREKLNIPIYLAGGLNPDNVIEAIEEVRPFGLDICSGLRTNGKLDEKKLEMFTSEIFALY